MMIRMSSKSSHMFCHITLSYVIVFGPGDQTKNQGMFIERLKRRRQSKQTSLQLDRIHGITLIEQIGHGSFSKVYIAERGESVNVAVKVLEESETLTRAWIEREVDIANQGIRLIEHRVLFCKLIVRFINFN